LAVGARRLGRHREKKSFYGLSKVKIIVLLLLDIFLGWMAGWRNVPVPALVICIYSSCRSPFYSFYFFIPASLMNHSPPSTFPICYPVILSFTSFVNRMCCIPFKVNYALRQCPLAVCSKRNTRCPVNRNKYICNQTLKEFRIQARHRDSLAMSLHHGPSLLLLTLVILLILQKLDQRLCALQKVLSALRF